MRDEVSSPEALPKKFDLGQAATKVSEKILGPELTANIAATWRGAQKEGGTLNAIGFMMDRGLKDAVIASIPESGANPQFAMAEVAPSLAVAGLMGNGIESSSGLNLQGLSTEQLKGAIDGISEWAKANPQKAGAALVGGVGGGFAGIVVSTFRGGRDMGITTLGGVVIGASVASSVA